MDKKKINIGILFGGRSAEHEVSLRSAKNVFEAIDKTKYNPILIGINKTGKWLLKNESNFFSETENPDFIKLDQASDPVVMIPQGNGELLNLTDASKKLKIDVVFPVLHGSFGEDGTVQGLLKLADLPFIGSNVLGSAVGMDKDVMKRLLRDSGIPVGKFFALKSHETIPDFQKIKKDLGLPFFVKPANMGSSVGISKINDESEYKEGVLRAFDFDTKIVLEEYIRGREIECSVLGNEEPIASALGEIVLNQDFYSYDAKYEDEQGVVLEIPAKISDRIATQIQELSIKTFQSLSCEGLGRVDFFLKDDGKIIVNEINTIPGFTETSMYPKLWEVSGVSYTELIDRLIRLAIERFEKEQKIKTDYC